MFDQMDTRTIPSQNEKTVAQMAAFFLYQAKEKKLPHLKLMKLLYLADREMIKERGASISYDYPVSMQHGPVLSQTLNLANGDIKSREKGWETWISARANHEVSLRQHEKLDAVEFEMLLDHISPIELAILRQVWQQFGAMDQWAIRDWAHNHCAEWVDPQRSSCAISFEKIAKAVGFKDEDAQAIAAKIESIQYLRRRFAS